MRIRQYITFRLVLGLVLSALCIWLFRELAEAFVSPNRLNQFDLELAQEFYRQATAQSIQTYYFISLFGMQVVNGLAVALCLYYAFKRQWLHFTIWLVAIAGGHLLNTWLKTVFNRPRPSFTNPYIEEINASFPSGHAMMSMIAYGLLAYFLIQAARHFQTKTILAFAAMLIVLLIGISRLALGVHYFTDVIAGYLAGGVWLITCITTMRSFQQRRQRLALNRHPGSQMPIEEQDAQRQSIKHETGQQS